MQLYILMKSVNESEGHSDILSVHKTMENAQKSMDIEIRKCFEENRSWERHWLWISDTHKIED